MKMDNRSFLFGFGSLPLPEDPAGSSPGGGGGGPVGGGSTPSQTSGAPSASPVVTPAAPTTTVRTPSPSASPVEASPSPDTGIDFEALFMGGLDGEVPSAAPVEPALVTPVATPQPLVAQPQPAPTGAEPVAQPQVPAQPQPAAAVATPGQREQPPDLSEPGKVAAFLQKNEAAAIEAIANSVFKLSDAEVELLTNDAVAAIPQLMAKCFVKLQQATLMQIQKGFPLMFDRHNATSKVYQQNEDVFFKRWPGLNRDAHGDLIRRYAGVYRATNPSATREQMIEDVGLMVSSMAKVPLSAQPSGQPGQAAPTHQGNGRPLPQTPFAPAAGGGGGGQPQQSPDGDFGWMAHGQQD